MRMCWSRRRSTQHGAWRTRWAAVDSGRSRGASATGSVHLSWRRMLPSSNCSGDPSPSRHARSSAHTQADVKNNVPPPPLPPPPLQQQHQQQQQQCSQGYADGATCAAGRGGGAGGCEEWALKQCRAAAGVADASQAETAVNCSQLRSRIYGVVAMVVLRTVSHPHLSSAYLSKKFAHTF
jgi:hypothetical protein